MITPEARRTLHEALDLALNHDFVVSVNLHPGYDGEEEVVRTLFLDRGVPRTSGEVWVDWVFAPRARVVVFDSAPDRPDRPAPVPNGSPVSTSTPYVHASDGGF